MLKFRWVLHLTFVSTCVAIAFGHDPEAVERLRTDPETRSTSTAAFPGEWGYTYRNGPGTDAYGTFVRNPLKETGSVGTGLLFGVTEDRGRALYGNQIPPVEPHDHSLFIGADIFLGVKMRATTDFSARGKFSAELDVKVVIPTAGECDKGKRDIVTGEITLFKSKMSLLVDWDGPGAPTVTSPRTSTSQVFDNARQTDKETKVTVLKLNPDKNKETGVQPQAGSDVELGYAANDPGKKDEDTDRVTVKLSCHFVHNAQVFVETKSNLGWTLDCNVEKCTADFNFQNKVISNKKDATAFTPLLETSSKK